MTRRLQRGFTLLEVIIAFALLAAALSLLLGSLSGATRQVRYANDAGRAALHAQSLLAQVGVGEALQTGQRQGEWEDGRYQWQLKVSAYNDPVHAGATLPDPAAARLLELQLNVRWGDETGQSLQLNSLRSVADGQASAP